MPWNEPTSMEDYTRRMELVVPNVAQGTGMETRSHMPCPWCASPDWMIVRIPWAAQDMAKEATCERCGRSGRNMILYYSDGSSTGELVQTGGPTAPEWLVPCPRNLADLQADPDVTAVQEVARWQPE